MLVRVVQQRRVSEESGQVCCEADSTNEETCQMIEFALTQGFLKRGTPRYVSADPTKHFVAVTGQFHPRLPSGTRMDYCPSCGQLIDSVPK